jgi:hypothetical protein
VGDLDGIEVDEMLVQTNSALVLSSSPAGQIPDFPFAGNKITYYDWALPTPWKGQAQGLHFETVAIQPLVGPGGLQETPDVYSDTSEGFDDGHWDYSGDLLPGTPTEGSWILLQAYYWTAPYLKDSSGRAVWKLLGLFPNQQTAPWSDIITRHVTQQNGRWVDIVTSAQANVSYPFDLGAVTAARVYQSGSATVQVKWLLVGSTLQSGPTIMGPWTDHPETVGTNAMSIQVGGDNQFFRVRLPGGP